MFGNGMAPPVAAKSLSLAEGNFTRLASMPFSLSTETPSR